MQRNSLRAAAIGAALLAAMAGSALADIKDYEFQLVDKEVKQGDDGHRRQAGPQTFRPRHSRCGDLRQAHRYGPDAMEAMTAPLEAVTCDASPASTASRPT